MKGGLLFLISYPSQLRQIDQWACSMQGCCHASLAWRMRLGFPWKPRDWVITCLNEAFVLYKIGRLDITKKGNMRYSSQEDIKEMVKKGELRWNP